MKNKKLFTHIFLKNEKAVTSLKNSRLFDDGDAVQIARLYEKNGADGLIIFDLSDSDAEHEANLDVIRKISRAVDIPLIGGGHMNRAEDVKKMLYAGCGCAFLNMSKQSNADMLEEVSRRFGKEKIGICIDDFAAITRSSEHLKEFASVALLFGDNRHIYEAVKSMPLATIPVFSDMQPERIGALLKLDKVAGISTCAASELDFVSLRRSLTELGICVQSLESAFSWSDLKTNADGLVPVIVQDYRTKQVLILAYMNEEAFQQTLITGRMTYFSRSRQELWLKGETSGHYQFVKQISLDCDNDTLLARVLQVGAACHTGNTSCFYRDVVPPQSAYRSTETVLEDVMGVIQDRKKNPKEGSYTNYLFDKGIDKILKKLGEEATEIVIAAKNPNPEEIKYEISDFLYHMMVLMAERGVSWEDIAEELSHR